MNGALTVRVLVMRAAVSFGGEAFTKADLAVRCWEMYPDHFGLAGYRAQYPDAQRVLSKVDGAGGAIDRGWLEQLEDRRCVVTAEGRCVANRKQQP